MVKVCCERNLQKYYSDWFSTSDIASDIFFMKINCQNLSVGNLIGLSTNDSNVSCMWTAKEGVGDSIQVIVMYIV